MSGGAGAARGRGLFGSRGEAASRGFFAALRPAAPRGRRAAFAIAGIAAALLTAPVVRAANAVDPPDGAQDVSRLVQPSVVWTAPTAPSGTLTLLTPLGTAVPALTRLQGDRLALLPAFPLAGCTPYTLRERSPAGSGRREFRFTTACSDWGPPQQIDPAATARKVDVPADGPVVASDGAGGFVAAWFQDAGGRRAIWASRFDPSTGAWNPARTIDRPGSAADGASLPTLAADGRGAVLAAWMQGQGGHTGILLSRFDASAQAWSPPQRLDDPALASDAANPAIASDGQVAVVAWQQRDRGVMRVWACRRDAHGRWTPATPLSDPRSPAYDPVVTVRRDGTVAVAWEQGAGAASAILVRAWRADAPAWGDAVGLSTGAGPARRPAWAQGTGPLAALAWLQGSAAQTRVMLQPDALHPGPVHRVWAPQAQGPAQSLALAQDARGDLTVVWSQVLRPGRNAAAVFAQRIAGGRWGAARRLDPTDWRSAGNPVLATDPAGNLTVAWYQDGPQGLQVLAARRLAGAGWQAAALLSDPGATVQASFPALAASPAGSVAAVWQQFNGWRSIVVARLLP